MAGRCKGRRGAGRDGACRSRHGCPLCRPGAAASWRGGCSSRSATRSTRRALPLDPEFPEWGADRHLELRLAAEVRLADLLTHLYVLLPVLDDEKHYWVDDSEIEKLLAARRGLAARAPGARADHPPLPEEPGEPLPPGARAAGRGGRRGRAEPTAAEPAPDDAPALRDQRLDAVAAALERVGRAPGARPRLRLGRAAAPPARGRLREGRRRRRLGAGAGRRGAAARPRHRCTTPSGHGSSCCRARSPTATGGSRASTRRRWSR